MLTDIDTHKRLELLHLPISTKHSLGQCCGSGSKSGSGWNCKLLALMDQDPDSATLKLITIQSCEYFKFICVFIKLFAKFLQFERSFFYYNRIKGKPETNA
jgi:hypothetical protein